MNRVTPSGAPAWARTATIESFGGHPSKQNHLQRSAVDPLTDVDAASFARLTNDIAAVTRTVPFAILSFGALVRPETRPGRPVPSPIWVVSHARTMTGVRVLPYEIGAPPPVGYPRVDRVGTGDYTITFASEYTDSYGVSAPFAVSHVQPGSAVHTSVCRVVAEVVDAQSVRVRVYDSGGAPIDPDGGVSALAVY